MPAPAALGLQRPAEVRGPGVELGHPGLQLARALGLDAQIGHLALAGLQLALGLLQRSRRRGVPFPRLLQLAAELGQLILGAAQALLGMPAPARAGCSRRPGRLACRARPAFLGRRQPPQQPRPFPQPVQLFF